MPIVYIFYEPQPPGALRAEQARNGIALPAENYITMTFTICNLYQHSGFQVKENDKGHKCTQDFRRKTSR
jgi:hypothetical protein